MLIEIPGNGPVPRMELENIEIRWDSMLLNFTGFARFGFNFEEGFKRFPHLRREIFHLDRGSL